MLKVNPKLSDAEVTSIWNKLDKVSDGARALPLPLPSCTLDVSTCAAWIGVAVSACMRLRKRETGERFESLICCGGSLRNRSRQ